MRSTSALVVTLATQQACGFVVNTLPTSTTQLGHSRSLCMRTLLHEDTSPAETFTAAARSTLCAAALLVSLAMVAPHPAAAMAPAAEEGATSVGDTKMLSGAASTLDSGSRKIITRGVNLEGSNFSGKDMSGVSFQQSLVRGTNFAKAKLVGAGFFDADLSNCDFTGANLNQVNLEMANLKGASFKNAVVTEAYVSGATKMEPGDIEGADFTDTFLRKDQVMYLCGIAKGTNPTTKVSTAESLGCP